MLKNYLLTSVRSLRKHLSYSLINISGLALGLATCLLLVMWISHELSYDQFHQKKENIYRASMEYSFGGHVASPAVSPTALLPALLTLPEAETGVRIYNPSRSSHYRVEYKDKMFEEEAFYYADSTFFNVFSFRLAKGNPKSALAEPHSLVLTESMAKKYFGDEDPMGQLVQVNQSEQFTITGVAKDPPSNSIIRFDFIASFNSLAAGRRDPSWWSANYQTFVVLHPRANLRQMEDKTNKIVAEAVANELTGEGDYVRYNFLPLTDIYLRSPFEEVERVSDIKYVYIFSAVAFLVMAIACINYINLATARAGGRAREVGVRKVSGAHRNQLFVQFVGESFLVTFLSFMLAFFLAQLALPFFNELTGKNFSPDAMFDPTVLLWTCIGLTVISLVAGIYPALALTGFNPVQVLKGNFRHSGKGIWLRKSLVVFQFAISVVLIASTLIILKQLNFIQNKNLGFDRENTIILPLDAQTEKHFESLKTELKRSGAAVHVGRGSESPTQIKAGYGLKTSDDESPGIIVTGLLVDEEYLPTVGIEVVAGRNFTREDLERLSRDTVLSVILNEAALKALFIDVDDAVGKSVSLMGRSGEVIGVIRDFHYTSLHNPIRPLVIFPEDQFQKIFVRLAKGAIPEKLAKVQSIWQELVPHRPFDFEFLDQQHMSLYAAEQRMGVIASVFASLAIVIACLGLFGLVSFSAEQRKKEIGIRKVLGASLPGVVLLIGRDFSKLVFIAIAIGLPFAYWTVTHFWLSDFAYRTVIGWSPFAIATAACLLIACLATGYQVLKAAWIDPAETLRSE